MGNPGAPLKIRGLPRLTRDCLNFADASWSGPTRTGGYLHHHGNARYERGEFHKIDMGADVGYVHVPAAPTQLPANVIFDSVTRMALEGNHFTRLGAGGLTIDGGTAVEVRGNTFDECSGSGITVQSSARVTVEDNLVHHIGTEYRRSPAILVVASEETTVAHNEIHDVPHNGIVIIGGGIYLSAPQGSSFAGGAVVRGNVNRDVLTSYNFGLYADYGAAWITIIGNIVCRSDTPIALQVGPPLEKVAFIGNFWDILPDGYDDPPRTVTVAGNTVLPQESFDEAIKADPAATDILERAGRRVWNGDRGSCRTDSSSAREVHVSGPFWPGEPLVLQGQVGRADCV